MYCVHSEEKKKIEMEYTNIRIIIMLNFILLCLGDEKPKYQTNKIMGGTGTGKITPQ